MARSAAAIADFLERLVLTSDDGNMRELASLTLLQQADGADIVDHKILANLILHNVQDNSIEGLVVTSFEMMRVLYEERHTDGYFYRLVQRLGEVGLNSILRQMLKNKDPSGNTTKYVKMLTILNSCLSNVSAIEYICERKSVIFPCLLLRLGLNPSDLMSHHQVSRPDIAPKASIHVEFKASSVGNLPWMMRVTTYLHTFMTLSNCVMATKDASLSTELVTVYNVLDNIAAGLAIEELNKIDKDKMLIEAAYLLYLLAALGDAACFKKITSHECCSQILSYQPSWMKARQYAKALRKLKAALAREETDVVTLEPFERLASMQTSLYFVFCSLPSCGKLERKEGILKRCAKCKLARYCNKTCQSQHWSTEHRKLCLGREGNKI